MKKFVVLVFVAFTLNAVLGMNLRQKRQETDETDDNILDNKYGYERPSWNRPIRPNPSDDRWIWESQDQGRLPIPPQGRLPMPGQGRLPRPNEGGNWQGGNQRPNQGNQWQQPSQVNGMIQGTSTTSAPSRNVSTTQSPRIQRCIRDCPVTTEYNPVCGTDLVQYSNIGRLECARSCGVNVTLIRVGRCPSTTTAATSS